MKPLTEYAKATPARQDELLREWARLAPQKKTQHKSRILSGGRR